MSAVNILLRAIQFGWIVFLVYWLARSIGNKDVVRRQGLGGRLLQVVVGGLAFLLLGGNIEIHGLQLRMLPRNMWSAGIGAALTYAGLIFAVWARLTLGTNWSGIVTVKRDHQLITTGPYRLVRHPIYSGLLLAILGTAIAIGTPGGFAAVLVAVIGWRWKWRTEEEFMVQEFGEEYERYRRQTPALIPFAR